MKGKVKLVSTGPAQHDPTLEPPKRTFVKRSELSRVKMVAGNEKKYRRVVADDAVMEWVGIGWIMIRPATKLDRNTIPIAV